MGTADVTKTHLWDGADVFYALKSGAVPSWPATASDPFPGTLKQVGILDGGDGFTESRSEDKNDFFGWGGILLRTSRAHFKMTRTFTALEDNEETRALIYPGSAAGKISVPKPVPVYLAFELRDGDVVHRAWTLGHAICEISGDLKWGEADITKFPILATIYPTGGGDLFQTQDSDDEDSSSV